MESPIIIQGSDYWFLNTKSSSRKADLKEWSLGAINICEKPAGFIDGVDQSVSGGKRKDSLVKDISMEF